MSTGKPTRKIISYNHRRKGPTDMDRPFFVTRGIVVIACAQGNLTVPAGAFWPGLLNLPAHVEREVQIMDTSVVPGTEWAVPTPTQDELNAGVALVIAQALAFGSMTERLVRAQEWYGVLDVVNQTVIAEMIGSQRESITKVISGLRHSDPSAFQLEVKLEAPTLSYEMTKRTPARFP